MNIEIAPPADVVKKEQEPNSTVAMVKKASKSKPTVKKAALKKVRKAKKVAGKKTARKPVAKKARKRVAKKSAHRPFPYAKVLKMWQGGKTLEVIARACGRYQKNADDPLHAFRVSLTRFHKGVRINGKLVRLPHRVSKKALKLATRAGKKAA